jgi:hypothetical protein
MVVMRSIIVVTAVVFYQIVYVKVRSAFVMRTIQEITVKISSVLIDVSFIR